MPRVTHRSAPRLAPLSGVVLALGVLLTLLGDVWRVPHLLLVHHRVCSEHGELVHSHGDGLAGARAPLEVTRLTLLGETEAHHHDHCGLASRSGKHVATVVVGGRGLPPAAPPARLPFALRGAAAASSIAVLAYAPKLSPPA